MTLRHLLSISAIVLIPALAASPSHATSRGIRVDGSMVCNGTAPSAGPTLSLGAGNSANVGVGALPVWSCGDSDGTDFVAGGYSFDTSTSVLYTWTPVGDNPVGQELSSYFGADNTDIVAMLDVFNLTGPDRGDTEVQLDYNVPTGGNCPASSASLSWAGKSYTFSSPCDAPILYFNSSGNEISTPVPEADTLALMGLAGIPLLFFVSRRRKQALRSP